MNPELYFFNLENQTKKQYEALRAFFYEKLPANVCAKKFGSNGVVPDNIELNSVYKDIYN